MAENTPEDLDKDILEEEDTEEKHFHDLKSHHVSHLQVGTGMVHSATTDTLDSVYLEPPNPEPDLDSDLNLDLAFKEEVEGAEDSQTKLENKPLSKDSQGHKEADNQVDKEANDVSFHIEGGTTEIKSSESVPSLSKYFGKEVDENDPFASLQGPEDSSPVNIPKVGTDSGLEGKIEDAMNEMVDLTLDDSKDILEDLDSDMNANNNQKPPDDLNVESVDFDLAMDKNDSVQTPVAIEEKDGFESFTADVADTEALDALGMSPAAPSFMSEKNITDYFRQTSNQSDNPFNSFSRQISQTSAKSSGSQDRASGNLSDLREGDFDINISKITTEKSDTSIPASEIVPQTSPRVETEPGSASSTPLHQPAYPPSATLSPVDSPVHQPFARQTSLKDHTSPSHESSAFPSFPDTGDDPFAMALQMSDSDRQHDAWLPSEATKSILLNIATHAPGSYEVDRSKLCTPSLVITQPQGDPVKDLVYRYMGEQEALKRKVLTADSVPLSVDGIKTLMQHGCYRAAIELTARLLTEAGQDVDGESTVMHSPDTLQLWYCRFCLMMKLRMYSFLESEFVSFKNLDTPDIYYEFYPQQFPGKRGSMVPFGMRLLHAELPHHLGRSTETLDRYYYILAICQEIQKNLAEGLSEDGSALAVTAESRKVSQALWQEREKRLYYLIANVLVLVKDYDAALSVYEILLEKDKEHRYSLLCGLGRIHLQIGNMSKAAEYFQMVKSAGSGQVSPATVHLNRGFEAMCQNNFTEAYQSFKQAVQADPSNTSAVNNMSVCCLYMGKLKEALKSLEALVHQDPSKNLHEGILFNLCTLYELESSRALHKKQALLDLVSKHKGDGFPVVCLKMV